MHGQGEFQKAGPIARVREGMTVVDARGKKIGTVEGMRMGDPEAATTQGNEVEEPGLLGFVAMTVFGDEREPDVPEPFRSRLLRRGFVKIDGPGLMGQDRYVAADRIREVVGDTVHLAVTEEQTIPED